ncbi:hypothetical protein GOHSU_53_00050 [Gordonia hirsuta DSM 44140 = NBRC 16056]|uniref:N-acetyltransferase domain-containing protein n=1 Tax=Gordonia hirsuta DSM 44140 = NBRC 16056 TaxID=1121927 RepID=L7LD09_9ACTN|nr:GNAT family N-acetyltransferase [Gordonia hirsuta]GAC58804.1 hypothetical protein GOHSU_53_00050 [Gordonia hirsuta DSM 44140 = NBRC 16056]
MPSPGSDLAVQRTFLHRGEAALIMVSSLLFTLAALIWGYRAKARCTGEPFDELGRSFNFPGGDTTAVIPCYSDLVALWVGRDINNHVFPYIHGGITETGQLYGGVVEYPVLSGLLMWFGAIGQYTDHGFFTQTALIMAPMALLTTVMLAWTSRWWVLLWAATPPLVLYAFHNWELPVVFTSVAAVAVMGFGASPDKHGRRRLGLRASAIISSVILALGFSLKIYPGLFVLALALYVLTGGEPTRNRISDGLRRGYDWVGAAWVVIAAILTTIAVQAPFMIAGYQGWKAALDFQGKRKAEIDTNTWWYWGVRFLVNRNEDIYNSLVGVLSPILILASVVVAVYLAWRRYQNEGVFPWIGASFALLAGFMVFHKVHSPQYTLWVLPFFVLLRVPWGAIAAYLVTDAMLDLTIFRMFNLMNDDDNMKWWVMGGVLAGVWVHFFLLLYFLVKAPTWTVREPLASYMRTQLPPRAPLTRLADADAGAAWHWLGTPVLGRDGITLRPLQITDAQALAAVAATGDTVAGAARAPLPRDAPGAVDWITAAHDDPRRLAFAVIDDASGALIGTTGYDDVDQQACALSIGHTHYAAGVPGTAAQATAELILLDYAFTEAGAVRVTWRPDADDTAAAAALDELGAGLEGLLPKQRRSGDSWRTVAQYAMTDDEWALSRSALVQRVG